jgi:1-acyl-sn-glycerol-3-phosphate acyltransferase
MGMKSYFKKTEWEGMENIPKDKPILFAANHQNAFLDGAVIGYAISTPIYFLGRADIFKKSLASKALGAFNCLPIYRERDGEDYRSKNDEVFERFYEILAKNRPIVIFPEGSHGEYKQIRGPLKKGVFRIGVGAENANDRKLDVHVVPVGIDYEKHADMGGNLLLRFGKPIRILDFISDDETVQEANYNHLVTDLEIRINEILIDIKQMDHYALIRNSLRYFDQELAEKYHQKGRKLIDKFHTEKKAVDDMEQFIEAHPSKADELREIEKSFADKLGKYELRAWLLRKEKHPVFLHVLLLICLFPIHLYGVINNYLPYRIPARLVERKVKGTCFKSSIKMILGAILFQLFWIIQTVIVAIFTDNYIWVAYAVSLPISGVISYKYWISWLKLRGKLRYNGLGESEKSDLMTDYGRLKNFIKKI